MRSCLALALCAACLALPIFAEDWPQWRGPSRNDQSSETGLLKAFDGKAPKVVWEIKNAGVGYSGPSIFKGKVYLAGGTIEAPKEAPKDESSEKKEEPRVKGVAVLAKSISTKFFVWMRPPARKSGGLRWATNTKTTGPIRTGVVALAPTPL